LASQRIIDGLLYRESARAGLIGQAEPQQEGLDHKQKKQAASAS
jgi:hypothetical protein